MMLLIFTALVVTSQGRPDELKTLPDASVFEATPPKEFLDLFKPDDSKKLNNPMNSPWIAAMRSQNFAEMSKLLPDQSVFEMTPPKEFLNLFRLKEKKNEKTENDASLVSTNKELYEVTSASELPKAITEPTALDEKLPKKITGELPPKENAESRSLTTSWSFEMNNTGENIKFPDWFYSLDVKPVENNNIDKQSDIDGDQKPHNIEWNRHSFESQSFYQPSSLEKLEPVNMFGFNEGLTSLQNIFIKKEENNEQVREKESSNITTKAVDLDNNKYGELSIDAKISKSSSEENSVPPAEKRIHDEEGVKINKNAEIVPKRDTVEIKPVQVYQPEIRPLSPKTSAPDNSVFIPVKIVAGPGPQNQHKGGGNMVYTSTRYPPQNYRLPIYSWQSPNQAYRYVYLNQPNHQSVLRPQSLQVKPVSHNSIVEMDSQQRPNDLIVSSIDHSSKDPSSSSTKVSAMLLPSQPVPQTRSVIAGNNMVFNSGDKLDNVDQTINRIPVPNVLNLPNNVETNQGNAVTDLRPELNQVNPNNVPNLGQLVDPNYGLTANLGQNNNYPQNVNQETLGPSNIPTNPPNSGYPVWIQPGNVASQNYPQNQPPVFVNLPYGSSGVPLNYVLANGPQTNGQLATPNYQINPGQGVLASNPTVGGYNQNVYALVPISNDYRPNTYLSNGTPNGYQVPGQVYNLIPVPNNVLTTRDEDKL